MMNTSKLIVSITCLFMVMTSCIQTNSSQETKTNEKVYIIDNGKKTNQDSIPQCVTENNASFSIINMEGIGNIYYTQSDTTSVRATGSQKMLDNLTIKNKNGHLFITFDEEKRIRNKSNLKIYLTSPQLKEVNIKGVGNFNVENRWQADNVSLNLEGVGNLQVKNLKCKNLDTYLHGVGNMTINVECDKINACLEGVGKMTLSGKTKNFKTSTDGIGKINCRNLEVENKTY